ncbi:mucin 20 (predicted), isoform CRA_b [Rattus norvegicus]|uniref:Mucin 20 (Predicted), isoform CRA_b n=1 Tax=Rattus norvegicus TaxID=10116 RepID=A6IRP2_RAT|nr:mucin 20 (predicted), isoform CRA_b [Rattus norvegicus]
MMSSVWGLAVPLLVFYWKVGVSVSSPGLGISRSIPLVTNNSIEVPTFPQRDRPSSERAFQTTNLTQYVPLDTKTLGTETAPNTLIATSANSELNSRDTQTTSFVTKTRKTHPTTLAAPFLETQTISPNVSTLNIQTTSPTASSLDSLTTFPAPPSSLTTFPAPSSSSLTTSPPPPPSLTTSPASSSSLTTSSAPSSSLTTSPPPPPSLTTSPAPSSPSTSPAPSSLTTFSAPPFLGNQTVSPVELTLKTQTIPSVTETRILSKRIPSNFMVVHTIPTGTLAPSDSPRAGMTTVKAGTVSDPIEAVLGTLCTDDSSEETRKITIDLLTLAHPSMGVEQLSSESSSSSDSSAGVLSSSQALGPDSTTPAKDSVAFSISHIKLTTCITEIETTITISGTPDASRSPAEAMTALSASEMLTLPPSTEAKPVVPKTTSSSGILSTATTLALATTLEGTLPASGITESEIAVAQTPTSSGTSATGGTQVTVRRNPLEDTSALSSETQSHTEVFGTITVPTVAGSTVGEATSLVSSTALDSSLSAVVTTKGSASSETLTTDNTTNSSFLTGSRPPSLIYSTTASTSERTNVTLTKTTASPYKWRLPPCTADRGLP